MTQTEAIIIGLNIRSQASMAKIAAMQAHDNSTTSGHYTEQAYLNEAQQLTENSLEIFRLSSKLSIDPPDVNIVGTSGLFGLNITSSRKKFT